MKFHVSLPSRLADFYKWNNIVLDSKWCSGQCTYLRLDTSQTMFHNIQSDSGLVQLGKFLSELLTLSYYSYTINPGINMRGPNSSSLSTIRPVDCGPSSICGTAHTVRDKPVCSCLWMLKPVWLCCHPRHGKPQGVQVPNYGSYNGSSLIRPCLPSTPAQL